jgi:hypothetical protein
MLPFVKMAKWQNGNANVLFRRHQGLTAAGFRDTAGHFCRGTELWRAARTDRHPAHSRNSAFRRVRRRRLRYFIACVQIPNTPHRSKRSHPHLFAPNGCFRGDSLSSPEWLRWRSSCRDRWHCSHSGNFQAPVQATPEPSAAICFHEASWTTCWARSTTAESVSRYPTTPSTSSALGSGVVNCPGHSSSTSTSRKSFRSMM